MYIILDMMLILKIESFNLRNNRFITIYQVNFMSIIYYQQFPLPRDLT